MLPNGMDVSVLVEILDISNSIGSVATGYGQPPSTLFDETLSPGNLMDPSFNLPREIRSRLEIEKFCDKVTKNLYSNRRDPLGLSGDDERSTLRSFLSKDFEDLEDQLKSENDRTSTFAYQPA